MAEKKEVFKGKSIEDLYKEVYTNSKTTKARVDELIKTMTDKVESVADAMRIMPLIKEYLDVGVKNDDQLIRLLQVIQRAEVAKNKDIDVDLYGDLQSLLDNSQELGQLPAPEE